MNDDFADLEQKLALLLKLVDERKRPNLNVLWRLAKDIELMKLNLKFFGYELARQLAAALPVRTDLAPRRVGLRSKPSTQADLESDWAAYWCSELKIPLAFHRKLWEFTYVLQALYEHDMLRPGRRGLGFGCGVEPLPSYLASQGVAVTATDLPPQDAVERGWTRDDQHAESLDRAFKEHLVTRPVFDRHVEIRYLDMRAIPPDLTGYDFCWSICALEHLGSIEEGLAFIENSLNTLRPGGLSVNTTEYNFLDDVHTVDNWDPVLYQRKHFKDLKVRLERHGHSVAELDFDYGNKPLDKFIDLPPYLHDWPEAWRKVWGEGHNHLKGAANGFAVTCFGLIIRKAERSMMTEVNRAAVGAIGSAQSPRCKICGGPTVVAFSLPRSKSTGDPIPDAPDDCPYFRCLDCDFLFATVHDEADHRRLYDAEYWGDGSTGRLDCVAQSMRLVLLANHLVGKLPHELAVLDFGCGRGGFMEVARNDLQMQVWGTDINPPRWGRDWFLTEIDRKFDIVIALEVVEHLPQPLPTFRRIRDMLSPKGVFAFQTAYYDPEVCGRDWWYLGPANGHISLYSVKALDLMFEELGGVRRLSWSDYPGLQAWQFD